ncbi:CD209 antigen-like protein C [Lacerta agilis]|uniref:CD209 antigen-like protein C n=1 Tax=Lacerta agilis TaxID=80427 RepID=UPI00141A0ECA|nr:CD209 antigen-like protein C [Lacerta agilis]
MAPKKPPPPPKGGAAKAPPPPPPPPEPSGMTPQRLKMIWMCIVGTSRKPLAPFRTPFLVECSLSLLSSPHSLGVLRAPRLSALQAKRGASPSGAWGEDDPSLGGLTETENLYKKNTKARSSGTWNTFGRNLYYVSKGRKTWYDAENFCVSRDSHLASVLSDEEQNYITSQLRGPAWIGFTDEKEEGKWEWTDGSRVTKQYWHEENTFHTESKRRLEKDCTSIVPSLAGNNWRDTHCHELRNWVCKESVEI